MEKQEYIITFSTEIQVEPMGTIFFKEHEVYRKTCSWEEIEEKLYNLADKFENNLKELNINMENYSSVGSSEVMYTIFLNPGYDDKILNYMFEIKSAKEL